MFNTFEDEYSQRGDSKRPHILESIKSVEEINLEISETMYESNIWLVVQFMSHRPGLCIGGAGVKISPSISRVYKWIYSP